MKNLAAVCLPLLLAAAASAQVLMSAEQAGELAAAQTRAKSLAERLRPASVDKAAVRALSNRLSEEGEEVEMGGAIGNVLTRFGRPGAGGRFKNIQANLVEIPAELVEPQGEAITQAVLRRYFSHLEATSEAWRIDEKKGTGTVHVWAFTIALDGRMLECVHQIVPLERGPDGGLVPNELGGRSYRMPPSDPSVQLRWKRLSKELLLLGRTREA